jgi:uncharacterized protein
MRWLLIALIRVYQYTLSGLFGPCCRFYPSCSEYTLRAIRRHGCLRGGWLGVKRICKCHPYHPGGVDLVPGEEEGGVETPVRMRHEQA